MDVDDVYQVAARDWPERRLVQRQQIAADLADVADIAIALGTGSSDVDVLPVDIQTDMQDACGSLRSPFLCSLTRPGCAWPGALV